MRRKVRIGIVGLVHDHVWGVLNQFVALDNAEVACAADVNEPLLKRVKDLGVKKTYKRYEDLLANEKIDAVIAYTENSCAADITEATAERGLHVMVEKPMAANLEQARRMYRAAEKWGVRLMVNYPTTWSPVVRHASKLAQEGFVGRIYQVKYRAGHEGPKEIGCSRYFYEWLYDEKLNGAGAFMDFCCYGANICRWILGVPDKALALGGTYVRDYLTVEDNAVLLMGYEKAMGIAEATWSQIGSGGPLGYPLLMKGSKGTIAAGQDLQVYTSEKHGWERIEPPPLEKPNQNGPEHFVTSILEEKPFEETVSASHNLDVQAILEAGLVSMCEGRAVSLNELV
ncbi:MAG: Gfo/Idh/MocA family protein [Candidatus Bathyarchaeia archaeon]